MKKPKSYARVKRQVRNATRRNARHEEKNRNHRKKLHEARLRGVVFGNSKKRRSEGITGE